MARKGKLNYFFQAATLIAVIFFGIVICDTLDRNRREIAELKEAINSMPLTNAVPLTVSAGEALAANSNAQYFDPSAKNGGVMTTAINSDVPSLNPLLSNEASASEIIGLCTSTLAVRDWQQPEKFTPLIANSWKVSPDGKTINIKLRQGILWHDFTDPESKKHIPSQQVTAHDFVFYVETLRNPQVNAGHLRNYYQDLASIRAVNDFELELVWKTEYYRSLEMSLTLSPLPRHFYAPGGRFDAEKFNYDAKRNDMIVGCGPYKLVSYERNKQFVLQRFNNYFGIALNIAPPIKKRVIRIVKQPNMLQLFEAGDLDMTSLTAEQWENRSQRKTYSRHILATGDNSNDYPLEKGEKFRRMKYLDNAYLYIGYNQRNELFADKRVRRAMTMLCNRQRIVNELYRGLGRVISGPFFCDSPYYNKNILPLPFDPARAKALLAEAGWRDTDGDGILDRNGKKFVFTSLIVAGSKRYKQLMEIFKEDLAAAGIDMKIVPVDWNVYLQRLNSRKYDMCCLGWSLPYESDPYQVWHSSQIENQGSNHVSFSNPRADKLIEDIRKTFDTDKRIQLCHEFHQLIHDEQPYTFLVVPEALTAMNGKLQNIRCFPAGISTEAFWIKE